MHALILAGGSGTRFWPMSRRAHPKQLVALDGELPMVARTIVRLDGLILPENTEIIAGAHLVDATRAVLPADLKDVGFVVEPCARNTAPAIALGAFSVAHRTDSDPVVVVLPSDHFVRDEVAFRQHLEIAEKAAEAGYIVTLGIEPTRPETGFGYINYSDTSVAPGTFAVERFVEKPDATTALEYLNDGKYLWNAGIFVFRVSALRREMARQQPEMARRFALMEDAGFAQDVVAREFPEVEKISIDFGIMEGAERIAVVPSSFGWSDVGHWAALHEVFDSDDNANVLVGERVVAIDVKDSVVYNASAKTVAAVTGVDGLVVVVTDDAVLVVPRDQAQDVRKIVDELERTFPDRL